MPTIQLFMRGSGNSGFKIKNEIRALEINLRERWLQQTGGKIRNEGKPLHPEAESTGDFRLLAEKNYQKFMQRWPQTMTYVRLPLSDGYLLREDIPTVLDPIHIFERFSPVQNSQTFSYIFNQSTVGVFETYDTAKLFLGARRAVGLFSMECATEDPRDLRRAP